jgi:hypothetical protein
VLEPAPQQVIVEVDSEMVRRTVEGMLQQLPEAARKEVTSEQKGFLTAAVVEYIWSQPPPQVGVQIVMLLWFPQTVRIARQLAGSGCLLPHSARAVCKWPVRRREWAHETSRAPPRRALAVRCGFALTVK